MLPVVPPAASPQRTSLPLTLQNPHTAESSITIDSFSATANRHHYEGLTGDYTDHRVTVTYLQFQIQVCFLADRASVSPHSPGNVHA